MNARRDAMMYGVLVVLSLAIAITLLLHDRPVIQHPTSDNWPKLTASTVTRHYTTMNYSIAYSPEIMAQNGKPMALDGFMLPLESAEKTTHFLLSMRAPTCPYCPPAAPNELVEVFSTTPMQWSDQLTPIRGTLHLADSPNDTGIFFQLRDAAIDQTATPTTASNIHAQTVSTAPAKQMTGYSFTEWTGKKDDPSHAVSLAQWAGQPLLLAFWRSDCAPCLLELRALPQLASQHPGLPILLIALQDARTARAHVPPLPPNVHLLVASGDGRAVLNAFGNDRMLALPYSVMLDATGRVCAKKYGIPTTANLSQWQSACTLS